MKIPVLAAGIGTAAVFASAGASGQPSTQAAAAAIAPSYLCTGGLYWCTCTNGTSVCCEPGTECSLTTRGSCTCN
jgi:hypothetical protein